MALTMPQTLEPHIDPSAAPGSEGYDKLRRRHGEIKLPMHAIMSRERVADDAPLYLRERVPGQAFVEVNFQLGEHPLGLVVDWSMALPVVSGVVPGSFAGTHLRLMPGIVLLAVNKVPVILGAGREEVEEVLSVRPLSLLFEAPDDMVFAEKLPIPWLQSELVAQSALSAGKTGLVDPAAATQLMRARNDQLMSMRTTSVPRGATQAQSVLANALTDQDVATKNQAGYQDFFQLHPERSPLSRFGNLNAVNPNPLAGTFRESHLRLLFASASNCWLFFFLFEGMAQSRCSTFALAVALVAGNVYGARVDDYPSASPVNSALHPDAEINAVHPDKTGISMGEARTQIATAMDDALNHITEVQTSVSDEFDQHKEKTEGMDASGAYVSMADWDAEEPHAEAQGKIVDPSAKVEAAAIGVPAVAACTPASKGEAPPTVPAPVQTEAPLSFDQFEKKVEEADKVASP